MNIFILTRVRCMVTCVVHKPEVAVFGVSGSTYVHVQCVYLVLLWNIKYYFWWVNGSKIALFYTFTIYLEAKLLLWPPRFECLPSYYLPAKSTIVCSDYKEEMLACPFHYLLHTVNHRFQYNWWYSWTLMHAQAIKSKSNFIGTLTISFTISDTMVAPSITLYIVQYM